MKSTTAAIAEPSELRKWYIVATLMMVYVFNFVDRQILSVVQEPMRVTNGVRLDWILCDAIIANDRLKLAESTHYSEPFEWLLTRKPPFKIV